MGSQLAKRTDAIILKFDQDFRSIREIISNPNSNRPEGGSKAMAKVMKSMKKVRRVRIKCYEG